MRGFLRFVRRLAVTIALVLLVVALIGAWQRGGGAASWFGKDLVAVVWVEGAIEDSTRTVDELERLAEDDRIAAVVLRVDSPGGGVAPSQEIYDAVLRLREAKPVVASLGNVAASGGYYVAAACDAIVANPGTLTGSIGVLMQFGNVEDLLRKVGVEAEILKAGRYKDIGSPVRPMSAEERGLLQDVLANVHDQFVDAIARGRKLEPADVRLVADGRIFSGKQALELALVDELGGLREAVRLAGKRANVEGEPKKIEFRERVMPWWLGLVGRFLPGAPGSSAGFRWLYTGPVAAG
jgi:protease IV